MNIAGWRSREFYRQDGAFELTDQLREHTERRSSATDEAVRRLQQLRGIVHGTVDDPVAQKTKYDHLEHTPMAWVRETTGSNTAQFEGSALRLYTAGSVSELWQLMKSCDEADRCLYEIIRTDEPCHLYFDLEFQKDVNPGHNGAQLVDKLVELVQRYIRCARIASSGISDRGSSSSKQCGLFACRLMRLSVEVGPDHIVETDSSTATKWSRHLLVHIPGHAFLSSSEVGAFVQHLLADPAASQLLVQTSKGTTGSFIDTAVYSRCAAARTGPCRRLFRDPQDPSCCLSPQVHRLLQKCPQRGSGGCRHVQLRF